MKKHSVGFLAFALTSVAALATAGAADMYRAPDAGGYKDAYVPVSSWTGFYAGVNGGYGWDAVGSKNLDVTVPAVPFTFTAGQYSEPSGGFGGGQIGYNWQVNRFVLGVETDIQISDISGSKTSATPLFRSVDFVSQNQTDIDWFGTVRGRLGYGWDNTLVYFTGGLAYGLVDDRQTGSLSTPGGSFQLGQVARKDVETGYVLGGGIEFKPMWGFLASPNWSVKAEYQYINLGSEKMTGTALGFLPITTNSHQIELNTVRVGLNYHIPTGYEPLK